MIEALYYTKLESDKVQCQLCPNFCVIPDGGLGGCRSRKNLSGVLVAINYSRTVSVNIDPIEKKPFYHYYPGSRILSLGANTCNLHCDFCQNYEISQAECLTQVLQPDELLNLMLRKNLKQVAFTYTEPVTWYEYILSCGKLLKEKDIRLVLVTNGYINQEPLEELLPYIDAMNIDLKSSRDEFYRTICKGKLQPIIDTIKTSNKYCHIELTNLLIPGLNDTIEEISDLINIVADVNPDIPLHFSRYYPQYKCDQPVTPIVKLLQAYELAKQKLRYVYVGNITSGEYSDTFCPNCHVLLFKRSSISTTREEISGGKCNSCGYPIYGRF